MYADSPATNNRTLEPIVFYSRNAQVMIASCHVDDFCVTYALRCIIVAIQLHRPGQLSSPEQPTILAFLL